MEPSDHPVIITDIRIPFIRLVFFLVKVSLAAIPATIILVLVSLLFTTLFAGLLGLHKI